MVPSFLLMMFLLLRAHPKQRPCLRCGRGYQWVTLAAGAAATVFAAVVHTGAGAQAAAASWDVAVADLSASVAAPQGAGAPAGAPAAAPAQAAHAGLNALSLGQR
jgi:hypothetical protein